MISRGQKIKKRKQDEKKKREMLLLRTLKTDRQTDRQKRKKDFSAFIWHDYVHRLLYAFRILSE